MTIYQCSICGEEFDSAHIRGMHWQFVHKAHEEVKAERARLQYQRIVQNEDDRYLREIHLERARRYWEDDTLLGGATIYIVEEEP